MVALKSNGAPDTRYAADAGKSVTVELVDGGGDMACASRPAISPAVSQTLTFSGADKGRKPAADMTVARAYQNLKCRVRDTQSTPGVVSCSADSFAVRPGAVTLATTASAMAPSATATPAIRAGAAFTVTAATSTNATDAYAGTLVLDAGKLTAQTASQSDTRQNGGAVGALTPVSLTANATTGNNARYGEVGYLYLAAGAYRDDDFTAVDQPGDCVAGSTAVVLSDGRYGCSIGNTDAVSFGRFIPDRFILTAHAVTPACGAFSYMGQPFGVNVELEARNAANQKTGNYSGAFARGGVTFGAENDDAGTDLIARLPGLTGGFWASGVHALSTSARFGRDAAPDGPFEGLAVGVKVVDPDGVALQGLDMKPDASGDCVASSNCTHKKIGADTKVRFGRLWLANAYGSDRDSLAVPYQAQYWNGSAFVKNAGDNCTVIVGENVGLGNYQGGIRATNIGAMTVSAMTGGQGSIDFGKPPTPASGSVDFVINLGASGDCWSVGGGTAASLAHLSGKWCGPNHDRNPVARATFGIFGSSQKKGTIYLRESY